MQGQQQTRTLRSPVEPNIRGGPPTPVSDASRVSRRSADEVTGYLQHEADDPGWSPLAAARRLLAYTGDDLTLLRATRSRLLESPGRASSTRTDVRALATLHVAVNELIERSHRSG